LERKTIEPVFVPSSDKTNFDATYDLEELLLEEAPLEARARRQKPRERLKDDATDREIREDELYRMIETEFRPFDYTVAAYKKWVFLLPLVIPNCTPGYPLANFPLESPHNRKRHCRMAKPSLCRQTVLASHQSNLLQLPEQTRPHKSRRQAIPFGHCPNRPQRACEARAKAAVTTAHPT
jgi:serine/threonine kinase 32